MRWRLLLKYPIASVTGSWLWAEMAALIAEVVEIQSCGQNT
jgi:hypothetical protein